MGGGLSYFTYISSCLVVTQLYTENYLYKLVGVVEYNITLEVALFQVVAICNVRKACLWGAADHSIKRLESKQTADWFKDQAKLHNQLA